MQCKYEAVKNCNSGKKAPYEKALHKMNLFMLNSIRSQIHVLVSIPFA